MMFVSTHDESAPVLDRARAKLNKTPVKQQ